VLALEALAEALRADPADQTDELRVRRERTRLLAACDRALVAPERRGAGRRRLALPAVTAGVLVSLLVLWRVRAAAPPAVTANAVVHADGATAWSERVEGNREIVILERGTLSIRVHHSLSGPRLLVALPDGELEDIGTTFAVSAQDDHTTRVTVQEGRVVLRLRDRPPRIIGSGETWVPEVQALVASAAAATEPVPSTQIPLLGPSPRSPPSAASVASALAPSSAEFRSAMDALDRGDNHEAATHFTSFLAKHPRDPRAEDAAYLRVIALQRCGDARGMKEAAQEYLRRYPAGFRYAEVERLSH
jgi:hypothetical protein